MGMLNVAAAIAFLLVSLSVPPANAADARVAVYRGSVIALAQVSRHHCHDRAYPVIRCFDTTAARDIDLTVGAPSASIPATTTLLGSPTLGTSSVSYVTFFSDSNYAGYSFTASLDLPSLVDYGWNDIISSFKSLNGQRPKWWRDINYSGTAWQWSASAWVNYVGDAANDQFSSVRNVP